MGELKGSGPTEEPADVTEARRQLYIEQAEKARLENAALRGESVALEEATALLYGLASIVASQLDAVAPRIAGLVAGQSDVKAIQTLLFDEHRAIRESIAESLVGLPEPGGGDDPPATKKDSRRVGRRKPNPAAGESGARSLEDRQNTLL
jgi:hypothetical protein